ncbi:MAG TPA: HYR domain-containing protein, partial [Saprospiraceae bacterium]|nr:HYR domain-containing protein [Saprospiraceae bacterium]
APPTWLSVPPSDITVQCDEDNNNNVDPIPLDACDGSPTMLLEFHYTPLPACINSYLATYTWTAGDKCGNTIQYVQHISVVDTEAPELHCPSDIIITSDVPVVVTWPQPTADDYCDGPIKPVQLSGLPSGSTFKPGTTTVITYIVTDECGNVATCSFIVRIKKVGTVIVNKINIGGTLTTPINEPIENAEVLINGDLGQATQSNGVFSFDDLKQGSNSEITPEKLDNPLNGVNTLDAIYVSNHILGLKLLDSPFKLIAGDVNNSGNISAVDLIQIKELILHIVDVFPSKASWTFLPKSTSFKDPKNPWKNVLTSSVMVKNIQNQTTVNFLGIKTGDVTWDAAAKVNGNTHELRGSETIELKAENITFNKGDLVEMKVTASDLATLKGLQFTLEYNTSKLNFKEIRSDIFGTENFGLRFLEKGKVTGSLDLTKNLHSNDLFTVEFIASEAGKLSDLVNLNSSVTPAHAYTVKDETVNLDLQFTQNGNVIKSVEPVLYQNEPNPFDTYTNIRFSLPQDQLVTLKIYDVHGKVVKLYSKEFKGGMNEISLIDEDFPASGLYFYEIQTNGFKDMKKMFYIR